MNRLHLTNEHLLVEVSPHGAELKGIRLSDGTDLLWPGDREPWTGSSPWLFPIVGRLPNDSYTYGGECYELPIHGFARDRCFDIEEHTPKRLTLVLRADESTRVCYPFEFVLRVICELDGRQVRICAEVENCDQKEMLFSLGAHPGLCCAAGDELFFEAEENAPMHRLTPETHLVAPSCQRFEGQRLVLNEKLFAEDAILLHQPRSRKVTLQRKNGTHVSVLYDDISWLGIWSRPTQPLSYVCIEPWLGSDSPAAGSSCALEDKPDILHLGPGEIFRFHMTIEPDKPL